MIISFETMNHAYPVLVNWVLKEGETISPRGLRCREIRPFSFTIENPRFSIYGGPSRKLSARFWAIETLSYLAGMGNEQWHAGLLVDSNKGMQSFINPDSGLFDGAYGPRISESLEDVIQLLKRDPDTRQAVVSIWSPGLPVSADVPCTVMLHFYKSKGKLDLSVYMRSNDLNWGTPYDIPAFCAIQLYVAFRTEIELGQYHHNCGSLHVYDHDPGSKGPCRPTLDASEDHDTVTVPTITRLEWIEPALKSIFDQRVKGLNWDECNYSLFKSSTQFVFARFIRDNKWKETNTP